MRIHSDTIVFCSLILLLLGCVACRQQRQATDEEEQRLFMLVYEPGAEGDFATAIHRADSLLGNVEMGDTLKAYIMVERSTAMFNSGQYVRAEEAADTLLVFSRKRGIIDMEIQALANKGAALRRQNRYDAAMECLAKALELATDTGDKEQEQNLADQLAVIYIELGRSGEAVELAGRALRLAVELDDEMAAVGSASTYGSALVAQGRYQEAIDGLMPYRPAALAGHPVYAVKYLTPLFTAYIKLDSLDLAEEAINEAAAAAEPLGKEHISNMVVLQAKAALAKARHDYQRQYALYCSIDSLDSHGKSAAAALLDRAVCLHDMGRDAEAFLKMNAAYKALDSLRSAELQERLSELSVSYGALQKDLEIERLGRHRLLLWGGIALSVLLLGIVVYVFLSLRSRALRRHAMEKQRQYVEGLEAERGRVARELHDDVAGRLTALRLALPAMSADEIERSLSGLNESVRSLSHRMLAPEFEKTAVTQLLLEYVRKLRQSIPTVDFRLSDEGSYDWSALRPEESQELYRIVQEAVSNALRHAAPSYIHIQLDGAGRNMELRVINDGSAPEVDSDGIGRRSIGARTALLGATLRTDCQDGVYILSLTR